MQPSEPIERSPLGPATSRPDTVLQIPILLLKMEPYCSARRWGPVIACRSTIASYQYPQWQAPEPHLAPRRQSRRSLPDRCLGGLYLLKIDPDRRPKSPDRVRLNFPRAGGDTLGIGVICSGEEEMTSLIAVAGSANSSPDGTKNRKCKSPSGVSNSGNSEPCSKAAPVRKSGSPTILPPSRKSRKYKPQRFLKATFPS